MEMRISVTTNKFSRVWDREGSQNSTVKGSKILFKKEGKDQLGVFHLSE